MGDLHHSDVELLSVLSKAVDELGLEWAPAAEPVRSRLDEGYLQSDRGRKDTSRRPGPFFPEVHDEIKLWNKKVVDRPDPEVFKELRRATDLALRATKKSYF